MDELIKKLLEAEILTEDSKKQIKESFEAMVAQVTEQVRAETEEKVRVELTEQFVADRDKLIEALDTKAEEFLKKELAQLHEDIDAFRDLEVEFAEKEVQLKKSLQEQVKEDMKSLVKELDEYLEVTLNEEFEELRESIEEAKKNDFGMKVFEAFGETFRSLYVDETKVQKTLDETKNELNKASSELKKLQEDFSSLNKAKKLAEVLEPLAGRSREVMEAILKTQPVEKLEETYKKYIGRVLNESATPETRTEEKEDKKVLAESDKSKPETEVKTVVKTGDLPAPVIKEGVERVKVLDPETLRTLKILAGN